MLQVNYLSTALLSLLLLPLLKASSTPAHPSHITFVASIGGHKTSFEKQPFKDIPDTTNIVLSLNDKNAYGSMDRYGISKMFVEMWTREFAEKVRRENVVVNSVCPGLSNSSIDRGLPAYVRPLVSGARRVLARSAEQGASTYIIAVTSTGESHGQFVSNGVVTQ